MDSQFLGSAVEMLILEVAAPGPTYGYEVAQTVAERSDGYFELKEGSLYPALHRLERQKLLRSFWREADGRRRKYYELTHAGRAELAARKRVWRSFAAGINGVLDAGGAKLVTA
jgi:DNA-binding PadR family transcriptional regulator